MITKLVQIFRNCFLATVLPAIIAGTPGAAIGVVISDGNFQMNNAPSTGSATVLDGSSVVAGPTSVSIRLSGGERAIFGADSRGTVFGDHLVLNQGSARIAGYSASANTLQIRAVGHASAEVFLMGKVVQVAALTGNVHVFSGGGVNVANLVPGHPLNIQPPPPGQATSSSLTGCVSQSGDRYEVTDEISRVTAELRGSHLSPGEKIRVTGVSLRDLKTPDGLSQVLKVTNVTRVSGTCKILRQVADTDQRVENAGASSTRVPAIGAVAAGPEVATAAIPPAIGSLATGPAEAGSAVGAVMT
ncbi:MAG: hypothetical protein M3N41_05355, partial [Acidobacteriota bacterium]|nr:hypothetical protein [Acidobacteriota bacterium]